MSSAGRRPDPEEVVPISARAGDSFVPDAICTGALARLTEALMNILHVRPRLETGGASEYLLTLGEGLVERGHAVFVASGGGELDERARAFSRRYFDDLPLSVRISRRTDPVHTANLLRSSVRLAHIARKERIDVIHSHHRFAALAGKIASRIARLPLVSTMHEVRRDATRLTTLGLGDEVVTLSEMMRTYVLDTYGVRPDRVHVIPMGLNLPPPLSESRQAALREELGLGGGERIIACIARLVRSKGHSHLLRAVMDVARSHPSIRLLLAGDGEERRALEATARELGINENVVFLGFRTDVPDLIGLTEFTVLPSLQEAFGVALLESLAQRKPIVATRVDAIPEIVKDGETGVLVPPADGEALARGIRRLLENPEVARKLGAAGLELVQREHSRSALVAATEALYASLLEPCIR
jgi:glycosyltransferase involved in cell wall biosynthesis